MIFRSQILPERSLHFLRRVLWRFSSLLLLSVFLHLTLINQCSAKERAWQDFQPSTHWQVRLLPGESGRVFSLYGCPGNPEEVRSLVARLKELGLANGFDPGPTTVAGNAELYRFLAEENWPVVGYPPYGGEFQVKHGRSRLTAEDEMVLRVMDQQGVFLGIQLGEWGYYLHELSTNEGWHRAVYGDQFAEFNDFIQPAGLDGYPRRMESKRECYEWVRDYFLTRHDAMRGRTLSVTGHSHYEAYVGEWGSRAIGLELGENIAFTQSKIAFARGASRRWGKPFSIQVSPWFAGSCTTSGPLRMETEQYARGLDAGHSLSFYKRMWLHAWFAGAALVTPENSISIFFEKGYPEWTLTEHGEVAREVSQIIRAKDPGVPYTPIAVVLDKYAGYNAYQGKPWGTLEPTPGDVEALDLFNHQIFPDSDHVHRPFDSTNPEKTYLPATPYGEMFDVQLSDAPAEVLGSYPALLLAGDFEWDLQFITNLHEVLRGGTRVLIHPRHSKEMEEHFDHLQGSGSLEVVNVEMSEQTQRFTAISSNQLKQLCEELSPLRISGDPVQYQINRTKTGWMVELVNPAGVIKFPTKPVVVDAARVAHVVVEPKFKIGRAELLLAPEELEGSGVIELCIPAGETRFLMMDAAFKPH